MSVATFLEHAQDFLPILLKGAVITVEVTVLSFLLSSVIGLGLALMRLSPIQAVSTAGATIVNIIRGLPIIVQLFYIYFVLPDVGIQLTAFQAGVIGLGIAYSAYQAENFRAGIEAVDPGQREAAQAMGMRGALIMRRVILPQAFRNMIPLLLTQAIILFQDTSLVYVSALSDFFTQAYNIGERDGRIVELLLFAGLCYFVICFGASVLVKRLQKKVTQ